MARKKNKRKLSSADKGLRKRNISLKNNNAINLLKKALQNDPLNPIYYSSLATVFQFRGELKEAIACYQKALEIKPGLAGPYNNMGLAFQDLGNSTEAVSCYQKALKIKPDHAGAYYNMGDALRSQGKATEAVFCYQKALELKPDYFEAYNNMGIAFSKQGDFDRAVSCYQKALEQKPDYFNAHNNIGFVLQDQGKSFEAITFYQKALELKPDYFEAFNNMGTAFTDIGEPSKAISCYQKALKIKPDYVEAYNNMGTAFADLGKSTEAISCYQKALRLKPNMGDACDNLVSELQKICAWQEIRDLIVKLDGLTEEALNSGIRAPERPFRNITRCSDPSHNLAIAKSWSCNIAKNMSSMKNHFSFESRRSQKDKIIVGYLSNDFRNHPVTHLMLGLFGLHNRDEFEVFCYSYGEDDGSYYRERVRLDCDKFVDIRSLNHGEAAKCIHDDKIDILVDLNGHTQGSRLEICALRPAPIQVTYLGFPGTTGADFFDYIITDRIVTPEDHAQYYSENFVYLPYCFQVNDNAQAISNKDWKKVDSGLSEDSFVFCSFNQGYKIEPIMFNSWMNILRQVPESVLWLQRLTEAAEKNLRLEAETRGVKPERLIFAERLPAKDEHLARLRLADLALDTRIYNGHTTTSDALWAGVPVITLQGSHFASRVSASILTAIGMSELIVHSLEEYENRAIWLALNPDELQEIGRRLAKNRLKSPIFDTSQFAKNLERAYKEAWEIFVTGQKPRQIEVKDYCDRG